MTTFTPDTDNDIFKLAADFVTQTSKHVFLTGKAGTGKTTFLKYISTNCHKKVLIAAPTGVAAINAGGVTVHSLFQLAFEPYIPNSRIKDAFKFGKAKIDLLRQAELLIIDEVSMLRVDMLDAIDNTMRFVRRDARPFGGVQMLYVGDMFQLPPVIRDEEWDILKEYYASPFFFHSKVIEKVSPVYIELKKVYRQQDEVFIDLLNRVRNNEITNADLNLLNQQYQPNAEFTDNKKRITLTTHNRQADKINTEKLAQLPSNVYYYEGEVRGDFPDYSLPTDKNLQLKVGAQIMFIKNDPSEVRRFYNGKLAEITELTDNEIYALPEGASEAIKIEKESWRNVRYTLNRERGEIEEQELGVYVQYPIRTAWAITIHKSQGLTFDSVIIDIASAFAAGQTYVALSRCTTLEGIIFQSPLTSSCVQTDVHAIAFSHNEKSADVLTPMLEIAKQQFWRDRLLLYFDWKPLLLLLNEFEKLTGEKTSDEFKSAHLLAKQLIVKALEQQGIAKAFQKQLAQIVDNNTTNNTTALEERCTAAAQYFYNDVRLHILQPIQNHRVGFSGMKRAKTYGKELGRIEDNVIVFVNNLLTIRYYDKKMIAELNLPPLRLQNDLTDEKSIKKEKKPKVEKGWSQRASLEMFNEGKSTADIASERNLSEATIAAHLIGFVKTGELDITSLMPKDRVDAILPSIKHITAGDVYSLSTIKEKLPADFSYNDIKAVINYWLHVTSDVV